MEKPHSVAKRLCEAAEFTDPLKIQAAPDCGLVMMNDQTALQKLSILVEGDNIDRKNLDLKGSELISIENIENGINPSDKIKVHIKYDNGDIKKIETLCRIDTKNELEYYKNGGILQFVLRKMI